MGVPFLFPMHLPLGIKSGLGGCRITTLLLEEGGDDETSGLKLYFPRCIYMLRSNAPDSYEAGNVGLF